MKFSIVLLCVLGTVHGFFNQLANVVSQISCNSRTIYCPRGETISVGSRANGASCALRNPWVEVKRRCRGLGRCTANNYASNTMRLDCSGARHLFHASPINGGANTEWTCYIHDLCYSWTHNLSKCNLQMAHNLRMGNQDSISTGSILAAVAIAGKITKEHRRIYAYCKHPGKRCAFAYNQGRCNCPRGTVVYARDGGKVVQGRRQTAGSIVCKGQNFGHRHNSGSYACYCSNDSGIWRDGDGIRNDGSGEVRKMMDWSRAPLSNNRN